MATVRHVLQGLLLVVIAVQRIPGADAHARRGPAAEARRTGAVIIAGTGAGQRRGTERGGGGGTAVVPHGVRDGQGWCSSGIMVVLVVIIMIGGGMADVLVICVIGHAAFSIVLLNSRVGDTKINPSNNEDKNKIQAKLSSARVELPATGS